jgi:polyhydroxyalkanoate synthesis regulator phasin
LKVVKWGLAAFGLAAVAGVVALAAGAFSGVAQAQEPLGGDKGAMHAKYEELLAQKLGVTVDQLEAAKKATRDQMIDDAVAAGRITADQGAKLKSGEPGDFRKGRGERIKGAVTNVFETAASILGLSNDEVKAGLKDGKSLNDLAAEKGISNFEAQMVAKLTANIQTKVTDGSITQEQADKLEANLAERVHGIADHKGGKPEGARHKGLGGRHGPAPQAPSQN